MRVVEGLLTVDTVIGPFDDGGYYLPTLGKSGRRLFENILWSSEETLSAAAGESSMTCSLLETLTGVDTVK